MVGVLPSFLVHANDDTYSTHASILTLSAAMKAAPFDHVFLEKPNEKSKEGIAAVVAPFNQVFLEKPNDKSKEVIAAVVF